MLCGYADVHAGAKDENKTETTMISRIQHIALIISSEKNLWFYELLGFQVCFRKEREYDIAVLMIGHGMELEIFIDPKHPSRASEGQEPTGLRHFALQIAVGSTLEEEIERLKASTREVLEIGPVMTDWTGVRFLFIRDPDGMNIELRE